MNPASMPRSIDSIGKPGIRTTTTPALLVAMVCCAPVCFELANNARVAAQGTIVQVIIVEIVKFNEHVRLGRIAAEWI